MEIQIIHCLDRCAVLRQYGAACILRKTLVEKLRADAGSRIAWAVFVLCAVAAAAGAYLALLGKLRKTSVMIEPHRLLIVREILGRKRCREYALDSGSRATLVRNSLLADKVLPKRLYGSDATFSILVTSAKRAARFGRFLNEWDRDWIVEQLNRHLESVNARLSG
jgi:hypothetical protein